MNHTLMDTRGSISVGSLLTDTQGPLIITQENRQQGQQLKTIRGSRETEGEWETKTRGR